MDGAYCTLHSVQQQRTTQSRNEENIEISSIPGIPGIPDIPDIPFAMVTLFSSQTANKCLMHCDLHIACMARFDNLQSWIPMYVRIVQYFPENGNIFWCCCRKMVVRMECEECKECGMQRESLARYISIDYPPLPSCPRSSNCIFFFTSFHFYRTDGLHVDMKN